MNGLKKFGNIEKSNEYSSNLAKGDWFKENVLKDGKLKSGYYPKDSPGTNYLEDKWSNAIREEAVMNNLIDVMVNNDLNAIEQLLRNGADINKKYEYDYTPLHVAVQENNIDIVKYFRAE